MLLVALIMTTIIAVPTACALWFGWVGYTGRAPHWLAAFVFGVTGFKASFSLCFQAWEVYVHGPSALWWWP